MGQQCYSPNIALGCVAPFAAQCGGFPAVAYELGFSLAPASGEQTISCSPGQCFLAHAALWSLHHTNLYKLHTVIESDGQTADAKYTTFGIRTLRFDPANGFFLDGKRVEIKGECNHADFPAVGIGAPNNLWWWRVMMLKKELHANAYRTSHNPVSPAFYRACDHLGVLTSSNSKGLVSQYTMHTNWSQYAWDTWKPIATQKFVEGGFNWTGFDYRGETTPDGWPDVNSHFGVLDICGFPKPDAYYYKAGWGKKPLVYICPQWDLPKSMIGKDVLVRCYANCDTVALFLNGAGVAGCCHRKGEQWILASNIRFIKNRRCGG